MQPNTKKGMQRTFSPTMRPCRCGATQLFGKSQLVLKSLMTGATYSVKSIVCKDACYPLLGLSVSTQMKLIAIEEKQFPRAAVINGEAYNNVFDGKDLYLVCKAQNQACGNPRGYIIMENTRISIYMHSKLEAELKRLENMAVIQ